MTKPINAPRSSAAKRRAELKVVTAGRAMERAFLLQQFNWPRWPLLHLKRRDGHVHMKGGLGVLYASRPDPNSFDLIVYFTGPGGLPKDKPGSPEWEAKLMKNGSRSFPNLDALLDVYCID